MPHNTRASIRTPATRAWLALALMVATAVAQAVVWQPALSATVIWIALAALLAGMAALWLYGMPLLCRHPGTTSSAAALAALVPVVGLRPDAFGAQGGYALGALYGLSVYFFVRHGLSRTAVPSPQPSPDHALQRERLLLDAAPEGVLWVNQEGDILLANAAMESLSGYEAASLVGRNVAMFLPAHLQERHAQSLRTFFAEPHARAMNRVELHLLRQDGEQLPVDISLGHWQEDGKRHAIAFVRDLRERKRFEESLRHQATHDELTGLPNRWFFLLQLNQSLGRAARSGVRVAVLFLDLDYFKTVNDSFGHATGDALLVQVGARIRSILRDNDTLARLGGDEFAILLNDLTNLDEAVSVANKLLVTMQPAYRLQDQDVYSGCSLGLAFYPDDAKDSETLLRYADMAMYQAKQAGRAGYACYSQEMDGRVHEDMRLHTRLKEAIEQGALELHYQPQVDVLSGKIVGAEALLRWHDPVLGHVSPVRFIPVAEATGLILPLSDWVLETACAQIAAWHRAGLPLRVAVNFSAQQFRLRDLPEKVSAALQRTGAQAQWLDIEITESVAMTQPEQAREQLHALVRLGCTVALDDFGTGYSSLSYLKALPVSKLKIDKSFMDGIPHDANDLAISRAIMALAHSLGLTLVAEGVETDAQLAFLRQHGCAAYQGWLYAKAMTAAELTVRLQREGV